MYTVFFCPFPFRAYILYICIGIQLVLFFFFFFFFPAEFAKAQEELKMLRELIYKKNSQGKVMAKMLNDDVDSQVQPVNSAPPSNVSEKVDEKPNQG